MTERHFISIHFLNSAIIKEVNSRPYNNSIEKIKSYKLSCFSDYNNHDLYLCSCYETYEEAYNKLKSISCGAWKEVDNIKNYKNNYVIKLFDCNNNFIKKIIYKKNYESFIEKFINPFRDFYKFTFEYNIKEDE